MAEFLKNKQKLIYANQLLIKTRWFYLVALAITGLLNRVSGIAAVNMPTTVLGALLFTAFSANLIYQLYFWKVEKRNIFSIQLVSFLQIAVDTVILTFTILLAGGIISVSFIYLTFAIIASGFFYQLRGVFFATTSISLIYCGLLWGQYLGVVPYFPRYNSAFEISLAHSFWPVFINTFTIFASFLMIGYFVGNFAKNIRRKEIEVINERDKGQAIIANLLDGLLFINSDQKISTVNAQAERLLDFNSEDVIGKSVKDLDFNEFILLDQLLNRQKPKGEMVPVTKPDSVYEIDTVEINDREGAAVGTVKSIHDISREKYMDKMKSEFITIAGHQLRTPLSAVKGAVSLILSGDYKDEKKQAKILREVYKYNDRMITLVDDLLAASSVEEGRYDYKFEPVDIKFLLKDIEERYQKEARDKAVKLNIKLVNNSAKVELDIYKIKLAIGTLIDNALTYTALGGKVSLKAEFKNKNKFALTVRDNGIGIPGEQQKKIFTKFFRSDNALKFQTEGNGLDLFITKNIIENHNGKIWFDSEEGFGTTFYVELPVMQPDANKKKK